MDHDHHNNHAEYDDEKEDYDGEDDDGEELREEEQDFIDETKEYFGDVWKDFKEESKDLSKRELAQEMFVLGAVLCKRNMDEHVDHLLNLAKNKPEEFKKILEEGADDFWEEGAFVETIGQESEAKMRTFHLKHDEEMNYNCRKCNAVMSAHNKDWHKGMCDSCFDKEVYGK